MDMITGLLTTGEQGNKSNAAVKQDLSNGGDMLNAVLQQNARMPNMAQQSSQMAAQQNNQPMSWASLLQ